MGNSNKAKSEQLGIPYGTACNKLRKNILFDFAQKLGMDDCFKCGLKIENINEFTIEHKLPWLGNNNELFWSLDNIAFSHSKCNKPHIYKGQPSKRRREDGKWLCEECKKHKDEDEFSLYNSGTPRNWCKICRAKRKIKGKTI